MVAFAIEPANDGLLPPASSSSSSPSSSFINASLAVVEDGVERRRGDADGDGDDADMMVSAIYFEGERIML